MLKKVFTRRRFSDACFVAVMLSLTALGWYANDGYRWTAETYRKAVLCDEIKCDSLKDMGDDLERLKLPAITKPKKENDNVSH